MPITEEHRRKLSESHKGARPWMRGRRKPLPRCLDCSIQLRDYRSKRCRKCANLGLLNPAFGKKNSLEARLKTSIANKGRKPWITGKKMPEEMKKKIGEAQQRLVKEGKHPFWKGGIYPENLLQRVKFRQKMQKIIFERDNYKCQICEATGNLQVDHIASWAEFKQLRFDPDNCRTLCQSCHYKITYGREMPEKSKWGLYNNKRRVTKFAA